MIAGVETGGTKIICAVADPERPYEFVESIEFPTTTPAESGERIRGFLSGWADAEGLEAVGVASFGPLDLDPESPAFGTITATPKPGWSHTAITQLIGPEFPFDLVSDVTGSAIGEARIGAGAGYRNLAYATVGTGVGVGAIMHGEPVARTGHPEMGHLPMRRHPRDRYAGGCPFHGDCLEGLASGPAMAARWGRPTRDLGSSHGDAVQLEAYYLGQLLATTVYSLVPQRIIIGGGVLKIPGMLEAARAAVVRELGGALGARHRSNDPVAFVVRPELGDHAGVAGALALAHARVTAPKISEPAG